MGTDDEWRCYAAYAAVDVPMQQRSIGCLNSCGEEGNAAQEMSRLSMMHSMWPMYWAQHKSGTRSWYLGLGGVKGPAKADVFIP